MKPGNKILIIQVAGLGWEYLLAGHGDSVDGLRFYPAESVFPAVTCTVQASFRTALAPEDHGVCANGFYDRALRKVFFWEQSAGLVRGRRIWQTVRDRGGRVALLFWQQSQGEAVDQIISPAPIHRHHGGMLPGCYSQPPPLYQRLRTAVGRPFQLRHYWGPLASAKSSEWIAEATAALLESDTAPDVCCTYLPALDYDLQRYGPDQLRTRASLRACLTQLRGLMTAARKRQYDILVFGDYAIVACPRGPVYPNRILRQAGWFSTRMVNGMLYADLAASRAFAVVDHEIARIVLADPADADQVCALLEALPGIQRVERTPAPSDGQARPADLTAIAADGYWMSYKWWTTPPEAPDYAAHVDIHNKPGFDPCELFFGWPPGAISRQDARVGGSHGKIGPGREIAWASTRPGITGTSLLEIAASLQTGWDRQL